MKKGIKSLFPERYKRIEELARKLAEEDLGLTDRELKLLHFGQRLGQTLDWSQVYRMDLEGQSERSHHFILLLNCYIDELEELYKELFEKK